MNDATIIKDCAPVAVAVPDALRALVEAIEFSPLGIRQIKALEQARAALAAIPAAPAAPAVDALDATDRECLAIGRAVNRAALELPADGEIRIDIENGAGAVYVYEPQREDHRYIDSGDVFSAQINAAIDAAIAAQAAAQGGEA